MIRPPFTTTLTLVLLSSIFVVHSHGADSASWLGFRGDGTNASDSAAPDRLAIGDDSTLAWQMSMPGISVAGPIVVGDLVVSTSSSGQDGEVLHVSGLDLATGKLKWEQSFRATGRPFCHTTSANAAPSPVSDGERIVAFFSSNDLICLSLEGELLWYRGLGYDYEKAGNDIGMAASPVIADGNVIVKVESQGDSFALAVDLQSGKNVWRIDRPKASNWSSPLVIRRPDNTTEIVMQSGDDVVAVSAQTGQQLWSSLEAGASIPSPTQTNGLLLVPGNDLVAFDVGGSASEPQIAWRNNKLSPRNASVVATSDRIYSLKGSVLVAANASDGETLWQERLTGLASTWATPVIAENKLYVFDQAGKGLIIKDLGDKAETICEVDLGEGVFGSPAVAAGRLIVRGRHTLFCFE